MYFINQINEIAKHYFTSDGGWSSWTEWGSCSVTCGVGLRTQQRKCDNPVPSAFGQSCSGNNQLTELCNIAPCSGKSKVKVS